MEMSAIPPNTPKLSAEEEEGALAPQEREILSGISTEAFKILKQPEDRDVWSLEDGDDAVFYSDEEQAQLNIVTASTASTGVKCRHLANTVTDEPSQQREEKGGEEHEANIAKENFDMGREMTHQITWTQEEEPQKFHTAKAKLMFAIDSGEQGADCEPTPGEFMRTCKELLQPHWTTVEMQAHPEQNASAEANRQVKEEEVELEAHTPDLSSFDVSNEEGYARLKKEANYPDQLFGAEGQKSGDGRLQVDQKAERGQNFNVHVGLHQNTHPGYSSLHLVKKSGCSESHQDSFNHLTSTKYSTMSYRRIRRGNTRQKIDEFEYMIINH